MGKNGEKIRTFIALTIPDQTRELIYRSISKKLMQIPVKISWVKPGNMHITLKFLGDINLSQVDKIMENLGTVVDNHNILELYLERIGTFGLKKFPRVLWLDFNGDKLELTNLANDVIKMSTKMGFEAEKRRFSSHLTLGRIRRPNNVDQLFARLDEIEVPAHEFITNEIVFMKSTLTPCGSIYEPLGKFELKKK